MSGYGVKMMGWAEMIDLALETREEVDVSLDHLETESKYHLK